MRKPDTTSITRFHRGSMGRKLENYLQKHDANDHDYTMIELERLWQMASKLDPAIGLHLFSQFTPLDWHILAYMAMFAENVDDFLFNWEKYSPLASDIETIRRVQVTDLTGIEITIDASDSMARYIVEHYAVMSLTMLRTATGINIFPKMAQFKHSKPVYHAQYRPYFGDHIKFGCSHNRLLYDHDTIQLTMPGHNKILQSMVFSELDRRINKRHQFEGWAGKVASKSREAISAGQTPSLENVAAELHHSPRTLRRRLSEQGFNYRMIIDAVRADLELQWELQGLNRSQIGERLGYSETSAYLYARKRWT